MSLVFCSARGNRGGTFAATAASSGAPLSDEEKIEQGQVGAGVPFFWLDANKINGTDDSGNPSDGGSITTWTSRTNSQTAGQVAAVAQPTWEENEINTTLPIARFVNQLISVPATAETAVEWDAQSMTVFQVWKKVSVAATAKLWGRWHENSSHRQFMFRDDKMFLSSNGSSNQSAAWGGITSSYTVDVMHLSGTAFTVYRDGSSSATGTITGGIGTGHAQWFTIGGVTKKIAGGALTEATADYDLAEFIIWKEALSDSDRGTVETYLIEKYGI